MGWAKLDDRRHENPKLRRAGLAAAGLDSYALTYVSANETDGYIDETVVSMLANCREWRSIAAKLVGVGRWTRDDERGGWWIVNYLEFNPSHQELEERRAAQSQRGQHAASARWGKKKDDPNDAQGMQGRMQDASPKHEDRNAPVPSRPVPSPTEGSKSSRRKPETAIPDDFDVTDAMRDWAAKNDYDYLNLKTETAKFISNALQNDRRCRDWTHAWRSWIIKGSEMKPKPQAKAQERIPRQPPRPYMCPKCNEYHPPDEKCGKVRVVEIVDL